MISVLSAHDLRQSKSSLRYKLDTEHRDVDTIQISRIPSNL